MKRLAAALLLVAGCSAPQLPGLDDGLGPARLDELHPAVILPSSRVDLVGGGFADAMRGTTRLVLRGSFNPAGGDTRHVEVTVPVNDVDDAHAWATAAGAWQQAFDGDGSFTGDAVVQTVSALDGTLYESPAQPVSFAVARTLAPHLATVGGGTLHVNDAVELAGDGFLLGTTEGTTHVVVDGCFVPDGTAAAADGCAGTTVHGVELAAHPLSSSPWERTRVAFAFSPAIAGIGPGSFTGTVAVRDDFADGTHADGGTLPLTATIVKPVVMAVAPERASLGEFVDVTGAGFVGDAADEITLLHLVGTFAADGSGGKSAPVDVMLVPEFAAGTHVRYVLDEADALGRLVDLRRISGQFTGTVTPIVRKGNTEVVGDTTAASLGIAPVKQVVYVRFLPSYQRSLGLYGLAGADALIRQRIFAVAARDYAGVNIEFRDTPPTDFALYSQVDVEGPDPNALGLLGYDNTPGKDVGNNRLFDRIGGVNATTQSDGFPGYGGIFAENFLGFSAHPSSRVMRLVDDPTRFDAIFDPVRPDTGTPVTAAEARGIAALPDAHACLIRTDRDTRVACAVFVLGNLIGTTLTHEVGHSLGLADPTGEAFHDPGDAPDRLMDAGGDRPFEERAELGEGPAVFCDDEYRYLKVILPGADTSQGDSVSRPGCN